MNDQLLADWYKAKTRLDIAKEAEMDLRERVAKEIFNNESRTERLGGYSIRCSIPKNYNLEQEQVPRIKQHIIQRYGEEAGNVFINSLFREKIELNVGTYNKLDDPSIKEVFDGALTITPGTPQLKITKRKGE
jgi:hypothetical protein